VADTRADARSYILSAASRCPMWKPYFADWPKPPGRTAAFARRRDRYPQNLDPVSAAGARRQPGDRVATDVPPFKFTQWTASFCAKFRACASNPARLQTPPRSRPVMPTWRSCRGSYSSDCSATASSRWGQISDLAADTNRPDLQQHGAIGSATAAAGADPAFDWRGRQDRRRDAERPHRIAMGRLPGGAGLEVITKPVRSIFEPRRSRS